MEENADKIQKVVEDHASDVIHNDETRKVVVEKVGEVLHNENVRKEIDQKLEEKKKSRDNCCVVF